MAEKVYVKGSVKKQVREHEGNKIVTMNVSLNLEDLKDKCYVNAKGYVNLQIVKRKEKDQYGNEYYICENTWLVDKIKEEEGQSDDEDEDGDDDDAFDTDEDGKVVSSKKKTEEKKSDKKAKKTEDDPFA